ncbi:repressor LexA [Caloranaerobacter azorensis DSM 13643]|uniref:Repressor LexA n=1 Tax=Caloranaerobacter azorensis DSM 13643 TaxID=1121264 RepID=A0A1M5VMA1_9FIRM|nr:winged helix DNA-binding protein [Caloranaerobacter azorensis]SHH76043.1 repressor LexA [Caloranaerobacter azorensis DSM 13643]
MITKRQVEILKAIDTYIKEKGYSPTIREICKMVNLKSSSTVYEHLRKLEKAGYIKRKESSPRAMTLTEDVLKVLDELK